MVAKLQGDKSESQSAMELYDPWISGPLCVFSTSPTQLTALRKVTDIDFVKPPSEGLLNNAKRTRYQGKNCPIAVFWQEFQDLVRESRFPY